MTSIDHDLLPEVLPPQRRGWRTADLARASVVALAVWFGLQMLWSVSAFIFLVFLATLFGLAVARGVDYIERFKIRRGIASALLVFGTIGAIAGGLALSAPTLIESGKELQTQFPAALTKLQHWVDSKGSGMWGSLIKQAAKPSVAPAVTSMPTADGSTALIVTTPVPVTEAPKPAPTAAGRRTAAAAQAEAPSEASEQLKNRLMSQLSKAGSYIFSALSSTLSVVAALVLLIFLAIYIGAEPEVYRGWLLATVPASARPQVRLVLTEMSTVLRKWLVTQLIAMVIIGVMSTIVLLVLGVQAPYALGFLAGLLEFIPTVGPVLSAVPAAIMGFTSSPALALKVVVAYWAIQFIENNLLIPYLMRGEMDLPPAITLVAQSLMTLIFGFTGLLVAVPLTAAILVPLRMVAERENAKERAMVKFTKLQTDAPHEPPHKADTVERTVDQADRGPTRVAREQGSLDDKHQDPKHKDANRSAGATSSSEKPTARADKRQDAELDDAKQVTVAKSLQRDSAQSPALDAHRDAMQIAGEAPEPHNVTGEYRSTQGAETVSAAPPHRPGQQVAGDDAPTPAAPAAPAAPAVAIRAGTDRAPDVER